MKDKALDTSTRFSILIVVCTIGGAILGASIQGCNNLRQQKAEFQANLVLKALDAGSQEEAAKYLKFLSRLGVLADRELVTAIDTLAVNPEDIPVFRGGNTAPSIILKGESVMRLRVGETFVDPGYIVFDPEEGSAQLKVTVTGDVDTDRVGRYIINYQVTDSNGGGAIRERYVDVVAN